MAGMIVGGSLISPRQAHAASLPLKTLNKVQARTLGALAEALVPGALEAGIIQYVDMQLAESNTLLILKYLGLDASAMPGFLTAEQAQDWTANIAASSDEKWQGPPAKFFFFVTRADACDVVFGTNAGSEALNIPYMAHIAPTRTW
jgi:hypothetical protein